MSYFSIFLTLTKAYYIAVNATSEGLGEDLLACTGAKMIFGDEKGRIFSGFSFDRCR